MVGYEFHDTFQPKGCNITINTTAVTAQAGSYVEDTYYNLNLRNQTCVDGMGGGVTMGGYLTGGGHSPLSHMYGLGADQVYEVEMVTPTGDIVTANECQNTDLFWAVRGVSIKYLSTFGDNTNISGRREHIWGPDKSNYSHNSSYPNRGLRFHSRNRAKLHDLLGNPIIFPSSVPHPLRLERIVIHISLRQHHLGRRQSRRLIPGRIRIARRIVGERIGEHVGAVLGLRQRDVSWPDNDESSINPFSKPLRFVRGICRSELGGT